MAIKIAAIVFSKTIRKHYENQRLAVEESCPLHPLSPLLPQVTIKGTNHPVTIRQREADPDKFYVKADGDGVVQVTQSARACSYHSSENNVTC